MQRLARIIPIVVAVFVVLVAATLAVKSRTARVESATAPDPAHADLRMKEVEIEEQSGDVRWRLTADQALVFEQEKRTALRNIGVVVHDKDRQWTIRAEEGDVVERTPTDAVASGNSPVRDVQMRKNVVVTSDDGMRLETTVLHWNGLDRRLWTTAPVRIRRGTNVVDGSGFELQLPDEQAVVSGRVRARFSDEDQAPEKDR